MERWDWSIPEKPYDLRERLFQFACLVKETHFRLRVLRKRGHLTTDHDAIIDEAVELRKIIATVVRNSSAD